MTEQSRLRRWLWLLAPILTARYDRWQANQAKERRRARAQVERLNAMADGDDTPPEPREPVRVNDVFIRMNRRRDLWRQYADELAREQQVWRDQLRRHHTTSPRDNFARSYDR
jgi:hypothetical protein